MNKRKFLEGLGTMFAFACLPLKGAKHVVISAVKIFKKPILLFKSRKNFIIKNFKGEDFAEVSFGENDRKSFFLGEKDYEL